MVGGALARKDYQAFDFLPNGEVSDIGARMAKKLEAIPLPPLAGKHVLDIGCDMGFWSFISAQGGAARVVGLDRNREVGGYPLDLIGLNREVAEHYPMHSVCEFYPVDIGRSWWTFGAFHVVYLFSLYHHIYANCGQHEPIWYWLWLQCRGELLWENPTDLNDPVARRHIPGPIQHSYNPDEIQAAAGRYFEIEEVGPAMHEPTRSVWRCTPRTAGRLYYTGESKNGAGGATKAFLHADSRRVREIAYAVGIKPVPGSLNVELSEAFDWERGYLRASVMDVADRSAGLDSEWAPRWARLYPCEIEGVPAYAFRFEGERYPDNFVELLSGWRLRNVVGPGDVNIMMRVPDGDHN